MVEKQLLVGGPWIPLTHDGTRTGRPNNNIGESDKKLADFMNGTVHKYTWRYRPYKVEPKQVIYVAHPVSGDTIGNCFKVVQWIKWFTLNDPTRVYIAPWVAEVLAFPDVTEAVWQRALNDDEAVVRHLDGIIMVGGKVSRGMQREWDCAKEHHKYLTDLSQYATPSDLPEGFFLDPACDV